MRHPTADDNDHRFDLRKHDWRPGDPPEQRETDAENAEQAAYAAAASYYDRLIEVGHD